MITGFVKVDRHNFYTKVWPSISTKVDAVQSNLKQVKAGEANTLLIHWGYKVKVLETEETVVLAVSQNVKGHLDEHWAAPSVLEGSK
jgi:putative NIF3 family GTP cyclohydrolase 1 type 2